MNFGAILIIVVFGIEAVIRSVYTQIYPPTSTRPTSAPPISDTTTSSPQCPVAEVYPPWTRPTSQSPDGEIIDYQPITSDFDGGPIDYLSGMSRKAWKVAQETHKMILAAAARLGNTSGNGAYSVYDRQRLYAETTWYSTARRYVLEEDPNTIWQGQKLLDRVLVSISKQFDRLLRVFSTATFFDEADHLAYKVHLQVEHGTFLSFVPPYKVSIATMMENAYARIYMGEYFLGPAFTRERRDAYTWASFWINNMNWHFLNLYELGCKSRPTMKDFTMFDPTVEVVTSKKKR